MDDCIFCKIANKEIPTSLVYEDDLVAAFNDLSPQAPVHVLIVPKKHYQSVLEVPEGDAIVAHMFHVASKLAKELGIAENGFRLVINRQGWRSERAAPSSAHDRRQGARLASGLVQRLNKNTQLLC